MKTIRGLLGVLLLFFAVALSASETRAPRTILVLMSGDGGNPTGTLFVQGFREALPLISDPAETPFVVYVEFLDLNRFADAPGYRDQLRHSFLDKYQGRHVDVIVTLYDAATLFALDVRDTLWPAVTIVASGVTPGRFEGADRPPHFTAWRLAYDSAGLVSVIRSAAPATRKIVLVSGASPADRAWLKLASRSLEANAPQYEQILLAELPLDVLLARLRSLPPDSVVLFLTFLVDGHGRPVELSSLAPMISRTANRPTFGMADIAIGRGALASHFIPTMQMGAFSCVLAQRVLAGTDFESQPLFPPPSFQTAFDAQQMVRWDIDDSEVPSRAVILFREPSLWHDHRALVSVTIGALITLLAFVVGLFIERRRRIHAQVESQQRLVEISAMDRRAALGELSASIAHEINQPLGAIMNNAEAAKLMLARPNPPIEELRVAVSAIRDDDRRASEIVRRIRTLVARSELDIRPLDLNEVVLGTLSIIGSDIRSRGIHLVTHLRDVPAVAGDSTHLQQVVLNVLMNALDSMKEVDERVLFIRTFDKDDSVGMTVTDSGQGFTPETLRRAFEPFFSTRSGDRGMGMGLAISRRIVEAHSGTITAENNPSGRGAVLTILLPRGGHDQHAATIDAKRMAVS